MIHENAGKSLVDQLRDGDIDAAVLGNDLPRDDTFAPVIRDHRAIDRRSDVAARLACVEGEPDAIEEREHDRVIFLRAYHVSRSLLREAGLKHLVPVDARRLVERPGHRKPNQNRHDSARHDRHWKCARVRTCRQAFRSPEALEYQPPAKQHHRDQDNQQEERYVGNCQRPDCPRTQIAAGHEILKIVNDR